MEELVTWEGTVHSVIFQNAENGYTVLRLLTEEGEVITVVGCIPCAAPGEHLTVSGVWEQHPQHGEQLRAVELERSLPEDEEEIFDYLSSGVCKGVGPATARRIVDRFGPETLDILEQDPGRLTSIRGITEKKAQEIAASFRQAMGLRRLMAFLAQYQLPPVLAMRLRQVYGDAALEKVRENPYLLSSDDCGVEFSATDEIAMSMGFSADCGERLRAAVTFELSHNENNGHVFLPRSKLVAATCQLLDCGEELVEGALDELIERRAVVQEPVANVEACYLRRLWEAEVSACVRLNGLLAVDADRSPQAGKTVSEIEAEQGITYAPQQRQAVELAARTGVVILTGGPGTGKTTTVRGIVALFEKMGLDIVLAAPTGRAAKRMSELTGREAQTVHRLLGMSWNEATQQVAFTKTEKEPLETDAVIVDEMSMVDLTLFSALLRALRPGTRLVLVGDADQLPSVGAGNVFSDLIRSGRVETVFLREVFRQAEKSAIIRNAHAVNLGQPPRLTNDQGDFFFMCRRDGERTVSTIVELCRTRLPEKMGIPADQIQVLTPTRKGASGTISLNRCLQEALNPAGPDKREIQWGDRLFREGDRIMQTRNDYNVVWGREDGTIGTGIFNGDVGKILQIDPSGEWLAVEFDGRAATYGVEMLNEIDLAYAMTVHKAQGSEYRCVVMAAMPAAQSLMVRGVLYTALTRARELLIVVGDDAAIRSMAANDKQQKRYSGLRWRLAHSER
ncbi:ATP-dependent RecD-like DNA helicase [Oscillibacter valericigenes]|uniref:SF1B family DNA helicase RecD2 n=1 Tax=Oscillibacter valericigenes TaxID=351091 RepID=UPI001F1B4032|nr:ATP-dependent RecD-like DNA helicase [Oscillibacter valericigenes]MCF2617108.1 ATP-dependent RecD-like DNA helicase [Oscillibacter valericigenes]